MKAFLILCISGVVLAQTPTPAKQAPAKSAPAPAASGAKTTPAAPARATAPPAASLNPAALKAKAPDLYRVKFVTTHGDFVVEVHRDWAPLGADRLYGLPDARIVIEVAEDEDAMAFLDVRHERRTQILHVAGRKRSCG